jgi:DNA-binding transcriptional ArsR family regulator
VAVRARFTRIPKVHDLVMAGVPTEAIATYAALADHANNTTGLCWPKMETLAKRLSRSPRTVQRHLHLLKERGLVEFVERRRDNRGRFGAYLYRVLHVAAAATARGRAKKGRPTTTGLGDGWPLIGGELDVKKVPPYPPKRTRRGATGGPAPGEAQEGAQPRSWWRRLVVA